MARRQGITKRTVKVAAAAERAAVKASTRDSFQNFAANLGIGTANLSTANTYGFNPISRNRTLLEWMYRGSWLVGKGVDCIAEDMTNGGVDWSGSTDPEALAQLDKAMTDKYKVWDALCDNTKWARLYGGSVAVMLIDGQRPETPLRIDTVGRDSFMGMLVLDRWMVDPSLADLVTDLRSPDLGAPKFYRVTVDAPALRGQQVHHSRLVRQLGVKLPYWQAISENLWGMSVIERLYDRLTAFDSATTGAAQLMFKAHLRTLKIPELRNIVAAGGKAYQGLLEQVALMRLMQQNEGITIMDGDDTFEAHQYAFSGISDILLQLGQQLAGGWETPMVRLFGESPAGLNSTGESDLRFYYDGIGRRQDTDLKDPVNRISRVVARSEGIHLAKDHAFTFNSLWEMDDKEKVDCAKVTTDAVLAADAQGILPPALALKELKQQSKVTGLWSNITDADIKAAEQEPAPEVAGALDKLDLILAGGQPPAGALGGDTQAPPEKGAGGSLPPPGGARPGPPQVARDGALPLLEFQGFPIMLEQHKGERRTGDGWEVTMPAHYGYIRGTGSAEGEDEGLDVFIGDMIASREAWVIDQCDPATGAFDEHKLMLGMGSSAEALACYNSAYSDGAAQRVLACTHTDLPTLRAWVEAGDKTQPFSQRTADRRRRASGDCCS